MPQRNKYGTPPAVAKANKEQKEAMLDVMSAKHPTGVTIKQIISGMKKKIGYAPSGENVRKKVNELVDDNLAHRSLQFGKKGATLYVFGPEPKCDFGEEQHDIPVAETAPSAENFNETVKRMQHEMKRMENKIEVLLKRSEYSTRALILMTLLCKEFGITEPATNSRDQQDAKPH
jgi:hypothetical protein